MQVRKSVQLTAHVSAHQIFHTRALARAFTVARAHLTTLIAPNEDS